MTTTKNQAGVTLTLTLADGTTITHTAATLPKNWKSVLLRQLPYGTDTYGATFTRERSA